MIRFLQIFFLSWRAWKLAGEKGTAYVSLSRDGVVQLACFVATGREAWRVSQRAIRGLETRI